MIPSWLIEALIVGPPCWVLGVVTGVKIQHHKLTREVAVQVRDIKAWVKRRPLVVVGCFLVVMALLTYQSQRESGTALHTVQDQSMCLTTYANQLYDSLTPRQSASEALQAADSAFNDALVTLLKEALSGHPDQTKAHADAVALAAAAQHKQSVADHLSTERAANPYPPPPKKVCPSDPSSP